MPPPAQHRPRREVTQTNVLSSYRRFWRGCRWELFALPSPLGLEGAKKAMAASVERLRAEPGVYEFALTARHASDRRIKVYVGESSSILHRHRNQYAKDGDHLHHLMDAAVSGGMSIWRRVQYVSSKDAAQRWESCWLARYDYAWNKQQNGSKRELQLRQHMACFCVPVGGVKVVVVPDRPGGPTASPAKNGRNGKQQARGSSPSKARKQQSQFLVG